MLPRETRLDPGWLEVAPDLGLRLTLVDIRGNSDSDGERRVNQRTEQ